MHSMVKAVNHESGYYLVRKQQNYAHQFYHASRRDPLANCKQSLIQYELHNYASSYRIVAFAVTCDTPNIQDVRVHPYTLSGNASGFYDSTFEPGCDVDIKCWVVRATTTHPTKTSLDERVNRIRKVLSQVLADTEGVVNPTLDIKHDCIIGKVKLLTVALGRKGELLAYDFSDEIHNVKNKVAKQSKHKNDKIDVEMAHRQNLQGNIPCFPIDPKRIGKNKALGTTKSKTTGTAAMQQRCTHKDIAEEEEEEAMMQRLSPTLNKMKIDEIYPSGKIMTSEYLKPEDMTVEAIQDYKKVFTNMNNGIIPCFPIDPKRIGIAKNKALATQSKTTGTAKMAQRWKHKDIVEEEEEEATMQDQFSPALKKMKLDDLNSSGNSMPLSEHLNNEDTTMKAIQDARKVFTKTNDTSLKPLPRDKIKLKVATAPPQRSNKIGSQAPSSAVQYDDIMLEFNGRSITCCQFNDLRKKDGWLDGELIDFVLAKLIYYRPQKDVFLFNCAHLSNIMSSNTNYLTLQLKQSEFPTSFRGYKYGVGVVHDVNHFKLVWIQFKSEKVSVFDSMMPLDSNLSDANLVCAGLKMFFELKASLPADPEDLYSASALEKSHEFTGEVMPHTKYNDNNNCAMVCLWHAKALFGVPGYQLVRNITEQDMLEERIWTKDFILGRAPPFSLP